MRTQGAEPSQDAMASETVPGVTGQQDIDRKLRESEEINRILMDATSDCIKVLDLSGRVLHMNTPGLCAMAIEDLACVRGQQWQAIWPANAREDIDQALSKAVGGAVSSFQAYCPTAKGVPKWWEVTVSPVKDADSSQVVRLLAVSRDITDRKEADEGRGRLLLKLEEAHGRLADVFRQAPAFMCVLRGPQHVFEMSNERYNQLVGRRNLIGLSVREALPEIEGQGFFELLDNIYQTGESVVGSGVPVLLNRQQGQPPEKRYVDLVYQALRDRATPSAASSSWVSTSQIASWLSIS